MSKIQTLFTPSGPLTTYLNGVKTPPINGVIANVSQNAQTYTFMMALGTPAAPGGLVNKNPGAATEFMVENQTSGFVWLNFNDIPGLQPAGIGSGEVAVPPGITVFCSTDATGKCASDLRIIPLSNRKSFYASNTGTAYTDAAVADSNPASPTYTTLIGGLTEYTHNVGDVLAQATINSFSIAGTMSGIVIVTPGILTTSIML